MRAARTTRNAKTVAQNGSIKFSSHGGPPRNVASFTWLKYRSFRLAP